MVFHDSLLEYLFAIMNKESMNTWDGQNLRVTPEERKIMDVTQFMIPKLPGIDENVGKAFSLYRFLVMHLDTPAAALVSTIKDDGKPLFTETELEHIQHVLRGQQNTPYFKHITRSVQSGGGPPVIDSDPSRNKFWDKTLKKVAHTFGSFVPLGELCKNWEFYIFFLYSLEQLEMIGPFVSAALDSITLSLPVLSDMASDGIQSLFLLLPIPYAALMGEVIGYVVGTLFLLFAIMLNMNRKHFGSAFKVSLELIPIFGDILAEAATNFEVAAERAMVYRTKMLSSVKPISPTAYTMADYYIPSVNIKNGTGVPDIFSKDTYTQIGNELEDYATDRLPIPKEKREKLGTIASNVLNVVPNAISATSSLLGNIAKGTVESAVSNVRNTINKTGKMNKVKQDGGRRRSIRRRRK